MRGSSLPPQRDDGGMLVTFGRQRQLVYPPTGWKPSRESLKAPEAQLRREHVFGCNGSIRGGLHLTRSGACLYAAAALCVVEDLAKMEQSFFEGHDADIQSLAYNREHDLAASGQRDPPGGEGAFSCVWSPSRPSKTLAELRYFVKKPGSDSGKEVEYAQRAISAIAISRDASVVCTFGSDDQHTVCVYELPVLGAKGPREPTVIIRQPTYTMSAGRVKVDYAVVRETDSPGRFLFATVGKGQFKLWDYAIEQRALSVNLGTFARCPMAEPTYIACSADDTSLLCGKNGHLYLVHGSSCSVSAPVCSALGCVAWTPRECKSYDFIAGGADGLIVLGRIEPDPAPGPGRSRKVGARPQVIDHFTVRELARDDESLMLPRGMRPCWNSVALDSQGLTMLGSANHCIVLLDPGLFDRSRRCVLLVLQLGHPTEAHALAAHPVSDGLFASGDTAGNINFWDTMQQRALASKTYRCDLPVWSLAFSLAGDLLAVGMDQGMLMLLTFGQNVDNFFRRRISHMKERICNLAFTREVDMQGTIYLGCCCWDQNVYLMKVVWVPAKHDKPRSRQVLPHRTLTGNSSSPTHLQFTADAQFVQSNSRDGQILVWKSSSGERVHSSSVVRDAQWAQWKCPLGWPVLGIWKPSYDLTDVNAVCQSSATGVCGDRYIAAADDFHRVLLHHYPAPYTNAECNTYQGHSAFVTNICFNHRNTLISLGGRDHTVQQWELYMPAAPAGPHAAERLNSQRSSIEPRGGWLVAGPEQARASPVPASHMAAGLRPPAEVPAKRYAWGAGDAGAAAASVLEMLGEASARREPRGYDGFRGPFAGDDVGSEPDAVRPEPSDGEARGRRRSEHRPPRPGAAPPPLDFGRIGSGGSWAVATAAGRGGKRSEPLFPSAPSSVPPRGSVRGVEEPARIPSTPPPRQRQQPREIPPGVLRCRSLSRGRR